MANKIYRIVDPKTGATIGRVLAPEGSTAEQAYAYYKASAPGSSTKNPKAKTPPIDHGKVALRDMSQPEVIAANMGKTVDYALHGLKQVGHEIAGGGVLPREVGRNMLASELALKRQRDKALSNAPGAVLGDVAGNVSMMAIPGAFAPKLLNPTTYRGAAGIGASMGLLAPAETASERALNTALGGIGGTLGKAGSDAVKFIGTPVTNTLSDNSKQLAVKAEQMGIPLRAPEKTGNKFLQTVDSVLKQMPFTAGPQAAIDDAKQKAFNSAVLQQIGEQGDEVTQQSLNAARMRLGQTFEDLSSNKTVTLGDDYIAGMRGVLEKQRSMPPSLQDQEAIKFAEQAIKDATPAINLGGGPATQKTMTGQVAQATRSELTKQAKRAATAGHNTLADALRALRDSTDEALRNSMNATERKSWDQARRQWGNLKILEKASNAGDLATGNVSGTRLGAHVKAANPRDLVYGLRQDDLGDLAMIGREFIRDPVPNSGTAQRTLAQSMLQMAPGAGASIGTGAAGVAVADYLDADPKTVAAAGLLSALFAPRAAQGLLNSPVMQKYMTEGWFKLPVEVQKALFATGAGFGQTDEMERIVTGVN